MDVYDMGVVAMVVVVGGGGVGLGLDDEGRV